MGGCPGIMCLPSINIKRERETPPLVEFVPLINAFIHTGCTWFNPSQQRLTVVGGCSVEGICFIHLLIHLRFSSGVSLLTALWCSNPGVPKHFHVMTPQTALAFGRWLLLKPTNNATICKETSTFRTFFFSHALFKNYYICVITYKFKLYSWGKKVKN